MRLALLATLSLLLHTAGCGGASTRKSPGRLMAGADGGAAGADTIAGAGGACPEPVSAVPHLPPFDPPPVGALGSFQVTFRNHCAKTVWPAWGSAGGLDNSRIDTQLWFPLSPGADRAVTVYGGVREIGFWGRTGCSFDQEGAGACRTGECGAFACPIYVNAFPMSATVFVLTRGFLGGYNVGLRVDGAECGEHECVVDVGMCSEASALQDSCGTTIACGDICTDSARECCAGAGSRCGPGQGEDTPASDDIVITFCPSG